MLDDTGGGVDDKPGAAEMIAEDAVRRCALNQVVGHVDLGAVDEAGDDVATAIELGDRSELVLIQEPLDESSVNLLSDSSISPVDHVVDGVSVGQRDIREIPEHIVGVTRGLASVCFCL